ncbi:MAG: hypothetical protein E7035_07020 [Verrucomicrobiaceae bacterium]|nr:hypothetical protein [Verrucomicrobiaceae bacterium]
MKNLNKIFLSVALFCLCGCSSQEVNKAELDKQEYVNSISNPENTQIISDVNTRFMTTPETYTIYEVFTGKEFGHGRLILRTDNENRTGVYMFIMFKTYQNNILKGTQIDLYLQTKKSPKVRKFSFVVPENSSLFRELVLGMTGNDAELVDTSILAWKIEVKNPEGKIITQNQSWLWSIENPSKPERQ